MKPVIGRTRGPELPLIQGRSCGPCTACCQWVAIAPASDTVAIAHERGVACTHLRPEGGCAEYGSRPKVCVDFKCLWLEGFGDDELDRPDQLGVMFHVGADENGQPFVGANEIREGALDPAGRGWASVKEMGFQVLVVTVSRDGEKRSAVMPMQLAAKRGLLEPEVASAQGLALAKD